MKGLNLSSFKKVHEDKHSATMMHKDGHKMVIAKAPLPALQRKQLEKLPVYKADGGEIDAGDAPEQTDPIPTAPPVVVSNSGNQGSDIAQPTPEMDRAPASKIPPNPLMSAQNAFQKEKSANLEAAGAVGNEGAEKSNALDDYQARVDAMPSQIDIMNADKEKTDKIMRAYQNKELNPDHYWQSHSKIASGIGMMLSGIGSGLTGQPNMAMQVVNNGINRDIDAQKNSQEKSMNLWKMNREVLGSDLAADLATKNQMLTGLKFKLDKAASNAQGPIALANAHTANAKIDQEMAMNAYKMSLLTDTKENNDPASRLGALSQFGLVPKEQEAKIAEEIDAAKNTVANAPGILEAFDNASKEVRPMTGGTGTSMTAFVPGMKSPGQKALIARLGPTFKDVEGTVRQAAMDNMEHNVSPNLGDSDETIASKRASLIEYLRSKSSAALTKANHIDLTKHPSTNTTMIGLPGGPGGPKNAPAGRGEMLSKSGRPMVNVGGVWHYKTR